MATPDLAAIDVVNGSAALLNDAAKTIYTFAAQLPYLNLALQELQEEFELNEVPVVDTISVVIPVDSDVDHIGFNNPAGPELPKDLIEPQILWERVRNENPYTPMSKVDSLPRYMEGVEINQFINYTWQSQEIRFLPSNRNNDIKMDYIRNLFNKITGEDDEIGVINSQTYLEYKTAALCAKFIGENDSRSIELNALAKLAIDRATGIGTKGRQAFVTRRRPFRSSYKRRSFL